MKKFVFVLTVLLLGQQFVYSQITITEGDFPSGGDTALISISDELGVDFETTGADVIWDYSSINISNQRIDTFLDISDASWTLQIAFNNPFDSDYESDYFNSFDGFNPPGADAAGLSFGNTVIFTKTSSSEIEKTGLGLDVSGVEVPAQYEDIDVEFELPADFGDSWSDYSFLDIDLNPAFNGILRRHQDRTAEVDGWGEITTWYGTFDVLRIRMDLSFDDSLFVEFGGSGTWIPLPTPDRHEYIWMTNDQKVPIMKIETTGPSGTEVVTAVEFKDIDRGFLSSQLESEVELNVYPNPATDLVYVSAASDIQNLKLIDLQGRQVYLDSPQTSEWILDLSTESPGVYQLLVETENGVATRRLIIN